MNGAGHSPMKAMKTISKAAANCSPSRISFNPSQRSLNGPKYARASIRRMYVAVIAAARIPNPPAHQ